MQDHRAQRHLVYLDNAATTQKPNSVIECIEDYYKLHNANIHRGVHTLSYESTVLYEEGHKKVAEECRQARLHLTRI